MKSVRIILLTLILTAVSFARLASWVETRPTSSTSYIGIGMATKAEYSSKEEWTKAAEIRALEAISAAISVSIQSTASLSVSASMDEQSELYQEDIKSFTRANLEGYEYVDKSEDRKEYWVYYKLDKAAWKIIEQKRLREGVEKAKGYLDNGTRLSAQGNVLSAARSYISAFGEILPILYLNPKITHLEQEVPLVSHIDDRMIALLSSIHFDLSKPLYRGTKASYSTNEKQFSLTTSAGPVKSFPMIIGKSKMKTDPSGSITVSENMLKGEEKNSELLLELKTDIDEVIPANIHSLLTRQWLSQLNWPSATAQIIFEKPSVYIESIEAGYDDMPYEQLEIAVKERLGDIGYGIARFPEDAEYRIVVKSSTRPAGSMGSLYFTYLDISWSLYNKSGDELMTDALKPVKGGALNYDDAGIKAYGKGSTALADRVITWIKENR